MVAAGTGQADREGEGEVAARRGCQRAVSAVGVVAGGAGPRVHARGGTGSLGVGSRARGPPSVSPNGGLKFFFLWIVKKWPP